MVSMALFLYNADVWKLAAKTQTNRYEKFSSLNFINYFSYFM